LTGEFFVVFSIIYGGEYDGQFLFTCCTHTLYESMGFTEFDLLEPWIKDGDRQKVLPDRIME